MGWGNHKAEGFLWTTGMDQCPLEHHKATKPAFSVGPSSAISGPFCYLGIGRGIKKIYQIFDLNPPQP